MADSTGYYKMINDSTGEEYYVSCNYPIKAEMLCEFLGLEGYHAESISEEEYRSETCDDCEGD